MEPFTCASLAKALRRHLSSAIDLLVEYGEHPCSEESAALPAGEQRLLFEDAIGDDLAMLGIGIGLAETAESS